MNADLEHLIVLQAQDLELARLRGELAEIPRRLVAARKALTETESALAGCRQQLATEEKLRRGHESDIATQRTKLVRLRRSLETAASTQQVNAFEHEIGFAEAAIARLEDEEFASLERTEALEAEQTTAATAVERAQANLTGEQGRTATLRVGNDAAVAGIERERSTLRGEVSPGRLQTYDKLAKARGSAVAEALGNTTGGRCAACQMGVRPQRWQELTGRDHLDEIFTCESCGRMLFWDPRRDTPRPWAAGERFQAAFAGTAGSKPTGGGR